MTSSGPTTGEAPLLTVAGQVVVVTGGGRGLGRAISEAFAAAGATVAMAGRDEATLAPVVDALRAKGRAATAFPADVSDEGSVIALRDGVFDAYGRIDVLVNNAGVNPWFKAPEDTTLDEWRHVIDINLTGVFLTCKHIGKTMLDAGGGSIVNISSIAGRVGLTRTAAYCASKGGVEMLTRQLAMEWAGRGVRVNAVAPGYVETDLTQGFRNNTRLYDKVTARTPLGRMAKSSEIVGACMFLASPAASYVTGQSLGVDGGWTAC